LEDPVRRHARERPGALAVRAGGRELTHTKLNPAGTRRTGCLAADGVGEGDRVATTLPAGIAFVTLLHALPRLRAVLVPLPSGLPPAERDRLLDAVRPQAVAERADAWNRADAEEGRREASAAANAEDRPGLELDPGAPHTVLFTSGSTGTPKPVELTYANHRASAHASAANLGVDPADRWLCVLPVHHVGGLAVLMRSAIYGTAAIVHERFEAEAVKRSIGSGEATLVSLVPTQLRRLADAGLEAAPNLRAALLGGGPVPRDLLGWAARRRFPVLQTYGMTETASQIATLAADEALEAGWHGSAGRPLPGVELRIAEPAREILVRGPMVSAQALAEDGWLHTGDRGQLDGDGHLWVEGRLDEVIVTGGENVAAAEVEEALLAHPGVSEAAVVGRPDREWGQAVTAYVVLEESRPPTDAELVAHCRTRLASFKAPKAIHRVEGLPRTGSGKVARSRLRPHGGP
jgi:o-succinylbenzoate---CoA ligase